MAKAKPAKKAAAKPAPRAKSKKPRGITLLIGTSKGAWFYSSDASRKQWRVDGPHFLGNIINHVVQDNRGSGTLLMAAKTGHLGPTIFRSTDKGKTWKEAAKPPAFPQKENGLAVSHTFWL